MYQTEGLSVLYQVRDEWTEDQYCQRVQARDVLGQVTSPIRRDAVRWCLDGKIRQVATQTGEQGERVYEYLHMYLTDICASLHHQGIGAYNDTQGYAATHALVCEAIRCLEEDLAVLEGLFTDVEKGAREEVRQTG